MRQFIILVLLCVVPFLVYSISNDQEGEASDNTRSMDCRRNPLEKCRKLPGIKLNCLSEYSQGCICYDNGTCEEGLVNACIQCQKDDVLAVEANSKCPCLGVQQS